MDSDFSEERVNLPQVNDANDHSLPTNAGLASANQTTTPSITYASQPLPGVNGLTVANATDVSAPSIADDVDLIEKDWVNKVSETIQKTKGDPYERARQLALLKSEYLQKRYQKTIKLT